MSSDEQVRAGEVTVIHGCPLCQRDEASLEANMWDRERGEAAVAAVPDSDVAHAADMLREYNGQTNSWGARTALTATAGMLRNRFQKARCDSDGVSACVRCNVMFLIRAIERLLAASAADESRAGAKQ